MYTLWILIEQSFFLTSQYESSTRVIYLAAVITLLMKTDKGFLSFSHPFLSFSYIVAAQKKKLSEPGKHQKK